MFKGSGHVLIVDDEPKVRELTGRALAAQGFVCDKASDGDEAFRLANENSYDGVVTDLRMPRRHGHALCLDLLGLPKPPGVMVLTALSDARLVRDLMKRGVHDVIQKPVNFEILAMKVEAMIDQGRRRRVQAPPAQRKASSAKTNLLLEIENALVELTELASERLDPLFEFEEDLPDPPKAVREFIRRLAEHEMADSEKSTQVVLPGHDARQKARATCYTTAVAVPVNREWEVVGDPFKLALRDLSEGGARLLYTRASNARYLALSWNATQLAAKSIRVVCQVRRWKPCGPFYDIGGQFVMAD